MSWAKKVDSNHGLIVEALRAAGWVVIDTHAAPNFVDLVIYKPSRGYRLVEVKNRQGKNRRTASQARIVAAGCPVVIVRSIEDAIAIG